MKNIRNSCRHLRPRTLGLALLLALGMLAGADAGASIINLTPSTPHVDVGQSFTVSFTIDGLSGAPNDSLGAFDLDLLFDTSLLRLTGFQLHDTTGANQLDFTEAGAFGFIGGADAVGGRIDLFGLSGNSAAVLDASQASAFQYAALTFEALAPAADAIVTIDLLDTNLLFVNSGAGLLRPTFGNTAAHVAIGAVSAVPEPSAWLLFLVGALPFAVAWRRRAARLPAVAAAGLLLSLGAASAHGALPPAQQQSAASSAATSAAKSTTTTTTATAATPARQETVSGVVTAVVGQRLQVRLANGSRRWFTTTVPLSPADVGKRINASASAAGDSQVLLQPSFLN